jgi:serine/threonine protein kinase
MGTAQSTNIGDDDDDNLVQEVIKLKRDVKIAAIAERIERALYDNKPEDEYMLRDCVYEFSYYLAKKKYCVRKADTRVVFDVSVVTKVGGACVFLYFVWKYCRMREIVITKSVDTDLPLTISETKSVYMCMQMLRHRVTRVEFAFTKYNIWNAAIPNDKRISRWCCTLDFPAFREEPRFSAKQDAIDIIFDTDDDDDDDGDDCGIITGTTAGIIQSRIRPTIEAMQVIITRTAYRRDQNLTCTLAQKFDNLGYQTLHVLGSGSYATVYKGKYDYIGLDGRLHNIDVALRQVSMRSPGASTLTEYLQHMTDDRNRNPAFETEAYGHLTLQGGQLVNPDNFYKYLNLTHEERVQAFKTNTLPPGISHGLIPLFDVFVSHRVALAPIPGALEEVLVFVTPLMQGSLNDFSVYAQTGPFRDLATSSPAMRTQALYTIAHYVAAGLHRMHFNTQYWAHTDGKFLSFLHADLSLANVLYTHNQNNELVPLLADFGASVSLLSETPLAGPKRIDETIMVDYLFVPYMRPAILQRCSMAENFNILRNNGFIEFKNNNNNNGKVEFEYKVNRKNLVIIGRNDEQLYATDMTTLIDWQAWGRLMCVLCLDYDQRRQWRILSKTEYETDMKKNMGYDADTETAKTAWLLLGMPHPKKEELDDHFKGKVGTVQFDRFEYTVTEITKFLIDDDTKEIGPPDVFKTFDIIKSNVPLYV